MSMGSSIVWRVQKVPEGRGVQGGIGVRVYGGNGSYDV